MSGFFYAYMVYLFSIKAYFYPIMNNLFSIKADELHTF